jgi:hypothetical protein
MADMTKKRLQLDEYAGGFCSKNCIGFANWPMAEMTDGFTLMKMLMAINHRAPKNTPMAVSIMRPPKLMNIPTPFVARPIILLRIRIRSTTLPHTHVPD